jgi:5-(carboxyamino)imidazole ribonucleotide synthase
VRVGILGGGQLGRMLALAGYPLGLEFRFLDPAAGAPAGHLAELTSADWLDREALARFAEGLDVVTYEFENVPVAAVEMLAERVEIQPGAKALRVAQSRLEEKECFRRLGIDTAAFAPVETRDALADAVRALGLPSVAKTQRMGYDGKGQAVVRTSADVDAAWQALGAGSVPLIVESFVPFQRELSVLAVRARNGDTAFYPLVENVHRGGILHRSIAPAPRVDDSLRDRARGYAARVLAELDYVGVLALELFQDGDRLLANEMAPRVHNSGHWTIEGAATSQFENHLRAVLGLPLGSTVAVGASAMVNLIGEVPPLEAMLGIPEAHVHLYGKGPRPGRKLGHVTIHAESDLLVDGPLARLEAMLAGSNGSIASATSNSCGE